MPAKPMSVSMSEEMVAKITEEAEGHGTTKSSVVIRALKDYFDKKILRGSWEVESSTDWWYDETRMYTGSQDDHGHSAQVRVNFPKNLAAQLQRVIADGRIPEYKSLNDFVRDAIVHRVHKVGKWLDNGDLLQEVHVGLLLAEQQQIKQQKVDAQLYLNALRENLTDAKTRGRTEFLKQMVRKAREAADTLPEDFQDELERELQACETWLKGMGVSLRPLHVIDN